MTDDTRIIADSEWSIADSEWRALNLGPSERVCASCGTEPVWEDSLCVDCFELARLETPAYLELVARLFEDPSV